MTGKALPRTAGLALLVLLSVGGMNRFYFGFLKPDLRAEADLFERFPDLDTPSYRALLEEVRRSTRPGDRIAIVVPFYKRDQGYSYAYLRGSFFLTGRRVIPVVDAQDRIRFDRVGEADYIVTWNMPTRFEGFAPLWYRHEGALLKRVHD